MKKDMGWDAAKTEVLQRIDIKAEAAAMGVEFVSNEPNRGGWLTCWAVDRPHGDKPNAGVNVASGNGALGRYYDFGGDGEKLSFFDLAAKLGKFPDWKSAVKHYADQIGVKFPSSSGKKTDPTSEKVKLLPSNDFDLSRWAKSRPPITLEAVKAAGARLCKWPAKAKFESQFLCVAFPAFRANKKPSGLILYCADGQDFPPIGDKLSARKTHIVRTSSSQCDGWVYVGGQAAFKAATTIWKTEGIPDAIALFTHLPDGHVVTTNIAGAGGAAKCPLAHWKTKQVIVIGDADKPGQVGAASFANAVAKYATDVRNIQLPYNITANHGKDLRDYFADGKPFADLLTAAAAAEPIIHEPTTAKERREAGGRDLIEVTPDEHIVNAAAVKAIAAADSIYQRSGSLVQVITGGDPNSGIDRPDSAPKIANIPEAVVRERLSEHCFFYETQGSGESEREAQLNPPGWCVKAVAQRGHWPGMRNLRGIAPSPILRRDGTILNSPGYDPATGLYLPIEAVIDDVPHDVTEKQSHDSRDFLYDLVGDFPFVDDDHKATWLASVLTVIAFHAFDGPAPLFLIDANVRGSGKSMLADLVSIIITGADISRTSNPKDDAECKKTITAIAMAGDNLILIDNIHGLLGCASLDAALTGTRWKDRILQYNKMYDGPLNVTWMASGNNVQLQADTSRRVAHIRLESPLENPEERTGFKYADVKAHARANRHELLRSALMILRGWHCAGRPMANLDPWGSFEGWSDTVRQAVKWCTGRDPGNTRQQLRESSDTEAGALSALLAAWEQADPDGKGMTCAEALVAAQWSSHGDALKEAIQALPFKRKSGELPTPIQLGYKLRQHKRRMIGGKCFDCQKNRDGVAKWSVKSSPQASDNDPALFFS